MGQEGVLVERVGNGGGWEEVFGRAAELKWTTLDMRC